MAGFIFGAGTPYKSHEDLKRQRAIADRLSEIVMSNQGASSLPEGLMDFGTGIMAGLMRRRADKTEARGRTDFNSRFNSVTRSLLGGGAVSPAPGLAVGPQGSTNAAAKLNIKPVSFDTPAQGAGTLPHKPAEKITNALVNSPLAKANSMLGKNEKVNKAALMDYFKTGGVNLDPETYAWCAAFVNATLGQSGIKGTGSNMARSFLNWGQGVDEPQEGDVAVLTRGNPNGPFGHVGFFKGLTPDGKFVRLLGGNQNDAVSEKLYPVDQVLGYRRAPMSGETRFAQASAPQAAPMGNGMQIMPVSAPAEPQIMPTSAPAMGRPATAFQRSEMARLENEVGVPTQQREARRQAIMGQQGGSAPSGGGFFTNMVPQGAPPEQMAQVQQAEVALEAMPIEQIAELASSPYAEPWQQNLMQKYLEHRMEQQFAPPPDPMEQRRKELELRKLEQDLQPKPQGRLATAEEKRAFGVPETAPIFIKPDGTPELLDVSKLNPQQADPTTNMRELAQINQERAAKGQQPLGLEEFLQSKRSGGITVGPDGTVQIGGPPGKLTEQQSKDVGFYNRASQVAPILDEIDVNLTQTLSAAGSSIPGVGNYLQTDAYRQARQAGDEFMMALLRKDTGAAVTEGEMALYGQTYLPRAGDDPQTIQQKREARARAIEGIRMGLGPAQILFREREMQGQGQGAPAPAPQQGAYDLDIDQIPEGTPVEGEDGQVYMKRNGKLWRQGASGWEAVQ